jgi:pyruvyltransferase
MKKIPAYWCSIDNYGDVLTPYLIRKFAKQEPLYRHPSASKHKFLITGSILGTKYAKYATIWGCGIAWKNEKVYKAKRLLATRGPISRQRVIDCGLKAPDMYGDPSLLLPYVYQPTYKHNRKHKIGIIPSWIDRHVARELYPDVFLIDVFKPVETVIRQINACQMTVASALHGLITSVAYGVPSRWVQLSDNVVGDGTKFRDFLASIKAEDTEPVDLREPTSVGDILELPKYYEVKLDREALLQSCPILHSEFEPLPFGTAL